MGPPHSGHCRLNVEQVNYNRDIEIVFVMQYVRTDSSGTLKSMRGFEVGRLDHQISDNDI